VKLNKDAMNPISNKPTVGFTATADIKRSDFGMTAYLPGLGDNVKLGIEVEANKA
jgi:polyisoprenoid-binding protein YceI